MAFRPTTVLLVFAVFSFLLPQPLLAHPGHDGHDFSSGWWHPLLGLDHLLAMVAVGLLAVRMGGQALWAMPTLFLGSMLCGGFAAIWGLPIYGVEHGILASVLVLGLLVAATNVVSSKVGGLLVSGFAVFHGYAHAVEMHAGGSWAEYSAGFLLATAFLHFGGVLGGLALGRAFDTRALRVTGGAISMAGLLLALKLI